MTAIAAPLSACAHYAAPVERVVERGDVRLRVRSVSLEKLEAVRGERTGEARVVLDIASVPRDTSVVSAWLSTEGKGCWNGAALARLGRSAATNQQAPLQAGERVTLAFPGGVPEVTGKSPGVALLVRASNGKTRCVAVPLTVEGGTLPIAIQERVTIGLEMGLDGFAPNPGPTFQVISIPATVGIWLGDYHLHIGAGPLGAGCKEPDCAVPSPNENVNYTTGFLGLAGVGRDLLRASSVALHVDLRYRLMTLPSDTHAGRQLVLAQGPTLEPILALGTPPISNLPATGGSRDGMIGIGVPLGYVFSKEGGGLLFGVDLRGFFTVL